MKRNKKERKEKTTPFDIDLPSCTNIDLHVDEKASTQDAQPSCEVRVML